MSVYILFDTMNSTVVVVLLCVGAFAFLVIEGLSLFFTIRKKKREKAAVNTVDDK